MDSPQHAAGAQRLAHLRNTMLVAAGAGVVYLLFDLRAPRAREAVLWRLSWIAALLAGAALQRPQRPRLALGAMHAAALWSGVAAAFIVRASGGSAHMGFGFLMALPLLVLVIAPLHPWAAALTGAATLTGGAAILVEEGRPLFLAFQFGLLSAGLTAVAVLGALGFRRVWLAEVGARAGRREALERLTEADRVAMAGQLGAGAAREITNPLSYVAANLRFARDGLRTLLPAGDPQGGEVTAALEEAAQGAARIAQVAKKLDIVGSGPVAPERERVDLARAVQAAASIASAGPHRVAVAAEVAPGLAVWGDAARVVQVVVHLAGLAAELDDGTGLPRALAVRTGPRGDQVAVEVEVEGGRLAALAAEAGGAPDAGGVRMWLCRAAAAEMGGSLEAGPAPEGRAVLRVLLPRAP